MAAQQDVDVAAPPAAEKPGPRPPAPAPSAPAAAPAAVSPAAAPGRDGPQQKNSDKKTSGRSWLIRLVFLIAVIIGIAVALYFHVAGADLVSTDDAFTDGRAITIAPRISGNVVTLAVNDNQLVHKGDLLLQLDPRDFQAAHDSAAGQMEVAMAQLAFAQAALAKARVTFPAQLAAAEGNLAAARGQLFNAQSDYKRQHAISKAATTQQQVDSSTASLQQAQGLVQQAEAQVQEARPVPENIAQAEAQSRQLAGQVAQAKAALAQATLNLSYTRIVAPQDGYVTKRNVEVGDYAQPGNALLALVTPQVWVTANLKEDQLARLRPGQAVRIGVDAYPDLRLRGHVDSVQAGSGSKFTAFPPENATGNFVKIVQRVPVKIDIDSGLDPKFPLPLGISVTPVIDVGSTREVGSKAAGH